jgi:hypothetical protein
MSIAELSMVELAADTYICMCMLVYTGKTSTSAADCLQLKQGPQ